MKNKNIYKGSWWFNNRRKHPSFIVKSNNNDYFEIKILSHKKTSIYDLKLIASPNPEGYGEQYLLFKKYIENSKKSFGKKLDYKFSKKDKLRTKKWLKK